VLRHAIHFSLQLLTGDRLLPVILQRLRLAEVVCDFLFPLRPRHHRIERWLGIGTLPAIAGPDAVTPIHVLDRSLKRYALLERERSLGSLRRRFRAEKSRQGSTYHRTRCGGAS
jgi:hypothetical protein